jgi:hypothetical protein
MYFQSQTVHEFHLIEHQCQNVYPKFKYQVYTAMPFNFANLHFFCMDHTYHKYLTKMVHNLPGFM